MHQNKSNVLCHRSYSTCCRIQNECLHLKRRMEYNFFLLSRCMECARITLAKGLFAVLSLLIPISRYYYFPWYRYIFRIFNELCFKIPRVNLARCFLLDWSRNLTYKRLHTKSSLLLRVHSGFFLEGKGEIKTEKISANDLSCTLLGGGLFTWYLSSYYSLHIFNPQIHQYIRIFHNFKYLPPLNFYSLWTFVKSTKNSYTFNEPVTTILWRHLLIE